MKAKLKSYLIILIFLFVGILIMGTTQLLKTPEWFNIAYILLTIFVIVNLASTKILNLKTEIKTFWSIKKIYFLPIGIVVGGLIAVSPILAGLLAGVTHLNELKFNTAFTLTSITVTLAIVAWEELWFRNIFLNYSNRHLSAINISITIGLLFMLIHLFNPEINLFKTGPTLFFAGALLTIVYFYFKTIWLPIGLHFGNNYLTLQSNLDKHWLFGNEGYIGAVILAILFYNICKAYCQ